MVLIDLNSRELGVVEGCLKALLDLASETSDKNTIQETLNNLQRQMEDIDRWQRFWEELNPRDKEIVDYTLGFVFYMTKNNIENMEVSPDTKAVFKKIAFRCELEPNVTPAICGCMRE